MEIYKLTKDDIENINTLLTIGDSLYECSKNLATLEIEEKKETAEYKLALENLKRLISIENTVFSRIENNVFQLQAYIDEIEDYEDGSMLRSEILGIITDDKTKLIKKRLSVHLNNLLHLKNSTIDKFTKLGIMNIETGEIETADMHVSRIVNKALSRDLYNTILNLLSQTIYTPKRPYLNSLSVKEDLLKKKYLISLVNKDIQEELIEHNFEIGESLYWTTNLYCQQNNLSDSFLKNIKAGLSANLDDIALELLITLAMHSDDLENAAFIQILLRSGFMFSNYYLAAREKAIENEGKDRINNYISRILYDATLMAEDDRNIPQTITIKLKREDN